MGVEEVVPGVVGVSLGYVNAFALVGEGTTLVDSGLAGRLRTVQEALAGLPGGIAALRHVTVTHHHMDHTGGLAALVAETGATVWAHPADAPVIRGDVPPPRPPGRNPLERAGIAGMMRFGPKAPPARVDRELSDGEELPMGLVAHHTPGHTAGHVSFLAPSHRLLFVGDAAARMLGRLGPPFGLFTEDHALVRESIRRLAALDFDVACFGHGTVLRGSAAAAFRRLAERLAA